MIHVRAPSSQVMFLNLHVRRRQCTYRAEECAPDKIGSQRMQSNNLYLSLVLAEEKNEELRAALIKTIRNGKTTSSLISAV